MSHESLFPMSERTALVTGCQGFIGIHASLAAHRMGARVVGADIVAQSDRAERVRESLGSPAAEVFAVDLRDPQAAGQLVQTVKPDVVIHCAGSIERSGDSSDWTRVFDGNAALTGSLVATLIGLPESDRPILVMPGSQMEYGTAPMPWTEDRVCEPGNAYGAGKLAATEAVLSAVHRGELRACVLRLPIVFGPGQPPVLFVPELITRALKRGAIPMTTGEQRRAFLYVEDAARLIVEAAMRVASDPSFPPLLNAPAYPPAAILEVARMLADTLDAPELLAVGALPKRPNDPLEAWPDASRAETLGLAVQIPLSDALRRTIAWYRANSWFVR